MAVVRTGARGRPAGVASQVRPDRRPPAPGERSPFAIGVSTVLDLIYLAAAVALFALVGLLARVVERL